MSYFTMVSSFQETFDLSQPGPPVDDVRKFADNFNHLEEELREIYEAYQNNDIAKVADGLGDLVYVALGIMHKCGIPADEVIEVIHRANMAKEKGETLKDGKHGVVKPEGWRSPEPAIASILVNAKAKYELKDFLNEHGSREPEEEGSYVCYWLHKHEPPFRFLKTDSPVFILKQLKQYIK